MVLYKGAVVYLCFHSDERCLTQFGQNRKDSVVQHRMMQYDVMYLLIERKLIKYTSRYNTALCHFSVNLKTLIS